MTVPAVTVEEFAVETVAGDHAEPVVARRRNLDWLGLLPFLAFLGLFLVWPTVTIFTQAFDSESGVSTTAFTEAVTGQYRRSFIASLKISLVTALLGGLIGVLLAYAAAIVRRPKWLRSGVTAFSGVAANFGGIPLAFAFIAALGTQGLMTKILRSGGLDLQDQGFTIYSFWGLVIVYLYFQIPLMVLVTFPAIDGLKPAWREAAANLGATSWGYWRRVGLPVLAPSILGGLLLLFANAFSAYATAYALSTGSSNLVTVQIRFFLQGNTITGKGQLGYALAAWMVIIMAVSMTGYLLLRRRAERWRRA
ncbi:MAG TPA: ABC transporter permease subunit [Acidimicrobiales bacterium]|nr:ABC transporter permease subunit [Acidimicrobiales bacterium]